MEEVGLSNLEAGVKMKEHGKEHPRNMAGKDITRAVLVEQQPKTFRCAENNNSPNQYSKSQQQVNIFWHLRQILQVCSEIRRVCGIARREAHKFNN